MHYYGYNNPILFLKNRYGRTVSKAPGTDAHSKLSDSDKRFPVFVLYHFQVSRFLRKTTNFLFFKFEKQKIMTQNGKQDMNSCL